MADIRIITEAELRTLVPLDLAAVACIENGFNALSGGKVVMPPILSMAIEEHNGEVDVKTAYVPGLDSFAIKMSPGFFDNPKIGLPSTSGLMILFSAKTGVLEALLLDNGYLTDVRTAAAGAVAARHLARENAKRACIIGAGMQARLQLTALTLVRGITMATIWARDFAKAQKLAAQASSELQIEIAASDQLEQAVCAADIIVTTTPATQPLLKADWLQKGQHVTAMGSDQHHKNEIEAECIQRADRYIADRLSQTCQLGELRSAIERGLVAKDDKFPELGDVTSGKIIGRQADTDITICDLTGTGVQDTAIATLANERAVAQSAGSVITSTVR